MPVSCFSSIGTASAGSLLATAFMAIDLQLLVGLRIRAHALRAGPSHFDLEGFGFLGVAAARIVLGQLGERGERIGALSEPVLRVGLPVERRVGARALQIGETGEVVDGAVPSAVVEGVVALLVELTTSRSRSACARWISRSFASRSRSWRSRSRSCCSRSRSWSLLGPMSNDDIMIGPGPMGPSPIGPGPIGPGPMGPSPIGPGPIGPGPNGPGPIVMGAIGARGAMTGRSSCTPPGTSRHTFDDLRGGR